MGSWLAAVSLQSLPLSLNAIILSVSSHDLLIRSSVTGFRAHANPI